MTVTLNPDSTSSTTVWLPKHEELVRQKQPSKSTDEANAASDENILHGYGFRSVVKGCRIP